MPTNSWDKWFYDSYAQGMNNPPPISSNNGMINPAPNTSQTSFSAPIAPVVTAPKSPTTYIPKTPSIPNAVPSAAIPTAPTTPTQPTYPIAPPVNGVNSQGLTPAQMGQLAEQQMKDRVIGASQAAPGTLQTGAQMGKLPDGTPITFQAYSYGDKTPTGTSPSTVTADQISGSPTGGGSVQVGGEQPKYVYDPAQGGYIEYKAPDTSSIDKQLADYYDPNRKISEIEANLKAAKESIDVDWNNQVRDAMRSFENRKQEQFSNLAGVGTGINPLSSAGMSVANANELLYNRFKENLDQERQTKIAAAEAAARGEKTDAYDKYASYLQSQRAEMMEKAEKDYNRSVDAQKDMLDRVYKAKQIAQMDRAATEDEKDDVRKVISDYLKVSGSGAFSDMSPQEILAMETKAGLPAGYIKSALSSLKTEEEAAKAEANRPEFKTAGNAVMQYTYDPQSNTYKLVAKDVADSIRESGGSLYNLKYDNATGKYTPELIIAKPVATGGGSSGGSGGSVTTPTTSYSPEIEKMAMDNYYKNTLSLPPSNKTQRQDIVDMFVKANPGITNTSLANPKNPFSYKQAPDSGSFLSNYSLAVPTAAPVYQPAGNGISEDDWRING